MQLKLETFIPATLVKREYQSLLLKVSYLSKQNKLLSLTGEKKWLNSLNVVAALLSTLLLK